MTAMAHILSYTIAFLSTLVEVIAQTVENRLKNHELYIAENKGWEQHEMRTEWA